MKRPFTIQYIATSPSGGLHAVAKHDESEERIAIPKPKDQEEEVFEQSLRQGVEIECDENLTVFVGDVALYKHHPKPCGVPETK